MCKLHSAACFFHSRFILPLFEDILLNITCCSKHISCKVDKFYWSMLIFVSHMILRLHVFDGDVSLLSPFEGTGQRLPWLLPGTKGQYYPIGDFGLHKHSAPLLLHKVFSVSRQNLFHVGRAIVHGVSCALESSHSRGSLIRGSCAPESSHSRGCFIRGKRFSSSGNIGRAR